MQHSNYARQMEDILSSFDGPQDDLETPPAPETEEPKTLHVYPVRGGGLFVTDTPIEDEEEYAPVVESKAPEPEARSRKRPPYALYYYVFMLLATILLDNASMQLDVWLSPTATVTLVTKVQSVSASGVMQARLLGPLTLSQASEAKATGRGHQDARQAGGWLTFYNGAFTPATIGAGTVYTGADGIQVMTDATATVPAAIPGNPPQFGQGAAMAHAVRAGAGGNIRAGDISVTGSALQVSNSAFSHGQDARDFPVVARADIDQAAAPLKAQVTVSMQAALTGELQSGEQLAPFSCAPIVAANPPAGEEAARVRVSISETCEALAYSVQQLNAGATLLLTAQAARTLGSGYTRYGEMSVTGTQAVAKTTMAFTCRGSWVYLIPASHIQALVSGKPRLTALRLLARLPGIVRASIGGIAENQPLPEDAAHIRVLVIEEA